MNGSKLLAYLRRELSGSVGDRLREIIVENANLVRTVPLRVATSLVEEIKEGALAGIRPETMVVEFMSRYPNLLKSRVELIARTESSKAQTALTRVRSELMDIHWYTWRTSQDFRVRSSHEHMEDVLVSWIDPPSPEAIIGAVNYGTYHAGDTFNCRCYPEPVIEWKYVKFPHKVYYRNAIRMMTWAQFKRIEDSARYSQAA
jgi:SPP1 gp7 family putative phage head morphogenesis protein